MILSHHRVLFTVYGVEEKYWWMKLKQWYDLHHPIVCEYCITLQKRYKKYWWRNNDFEASVVEFNEINQDKKWYKPYN